MENQIIKKLKSISLTSRTERQEESNRKFLELERAEGNRSEREAEEICNTLDEKLLEAAKGPDTFYHVMLANSSNESELSLRQVHVLRILRERGYPVTIMTNDHSEGGDGETYLSHITISW